MAHLIFDSHYDFYKLPEEERKKLVGRVFKERHIVRAKSGRVKSSIVAATLYFPVQLTAEEFNYSSQQGLIFVSPIWEHGEHGKWFRVAVASPDDLDLDLNFSEEHVHLRQEVISYMRGVAKQGVTYKSILLSIQKHFKAGEIWP